MSAEITQVLSSVISPEAVSQKPEEIASFKTANPLLPPGIAPSHIVRPRDVEELQKLVRLANEKKLKLVVASSTGKHYKGGVSSMVPHILVDLSGWKKILWINRRNRVCQVEPGVTYGELLPALEAEGMTIPMPLAPRKGKSVVAAIMDREAATWPNKQWDSADPSACIEFVFGTGDLFRTGAAGGPGSLEQQRAAGGAQKSPMGPSQTEFQRLVQGSQGTLGIVSWITIRTELKAKMENPCLLGAEDLTKLIPYVYEVQRPWLGEHSFILNRVAAGMLMTAGQPDAFDKTVKSLPPYLVLQNIAGFERLPKSRLKYQEEDIREIATRHGLTLSAALGEVSAAAMLKTANTPSSEDDWRKARQGGCLSIFFSSTLDRAPNFIKVMRDIAKQQNCDDNNLGIYIQPVVQNHSCHIEFLLPFNPGDAKTLEKLRGLEKAAVNALAASGAFFSRPYGSAAEVEFKRNPMNTEILKKVYAIFDPRGVLNHVSWGVGVSG